ncbi:MAG: multiheme c-type cytochrome [Crocinitomicaceae bacterium]|nr:multiheme c-type cytochrome [Crocinitomicaceae bacterium]
MKRTLLLVFSVLIIFGIVLYTIYSVDHDIVDVQPFQNSWEQCVPQQQVPEGLVGLSAESCGVCHQDHYNEWKLSTHSQAWTDQQFQAELRKESSPYLCINCHIPLQNQQEFIVDGLIDGDIYQPSQRKNPDWDKTLQMEGITCVACHLRDNMIVGPTGTSLAPHATVKDPDFLSESLCISCHNAVAVVTPQLACTFETGDEWKASPYAETKNCISCHMEEVERSIVHGYPERKSHFHSFPGSGIPKVDTLNSGMLYGLDIQSGAFNARFRADEEVIFTLTLKNAYAGHNVPTGDPERFILVNFSVIDGTGNEIWSKTERIGEKWQWHPVAKKLSDNNLKPNEERKYLADLSFLDVGSYTLNVSVTKHRMDQETFDYNQLDESYPISIEMYTTTRSFNVH